MEFPDVMQIILDHEKGLVNHPSDPGGLTNYGISLRRHPELTAEDILHMTPSQATAIYRVQYWDVIHADAFPPWIRLALMDTAVNLGPEEAILILQRSVGVVTDGVVGPQTLGATTKAPRTQLLARFLTNRAQRYIANPNFPVFGNGWLIRTFEIAIQGTTT